MPKLSHRPADDADRLPRAEGGTGAAWGGGGRVRIVSLLFGIAGLALLTVIVGWLGAGRIVHAAISIGWIGFGEIVSVQLALLAVLATAWWLAVPTIAWRRLLVGRAVRESATTCLPFAHVGGIAAGVRATTGAGTGTASAVAATVVDVTLESIALLAFIALGLAALVARAPDSRLAWPLLAGLLAMTVAIGLLVWLQNGGGRLARRALGRVNARTMFIAVGRNISRDWGTMALDGMSAVQGGFERAYDTAGSRRRLGAAASVHLAAWLGAAAWTWLTYRLLGVAVSPLDALAIEGAVSGILTLSFVVPAALGVQEAAYAAMGGLFGIPADLSIGLSLLRRARDVVIGVPLLLAWQGWEVTRIGVRRPLPGTAE